MYSTLLLLITVFCKDRRTFVLERQPPSHESMVSDHDCVQDNKLFDCKDPKNHASTCPRMILSRFNEKILTFTKICQHAIRDY